MVLLNKQDTLFERNEEGELLSVELILETLPDNPKIAAIPLTKGKIKELFNGLDEGETTKDQDAEIILNYCVNPKFDADEVAFIKPNISSAIVTAILSMSLGVSQEKVKEEQTKEIIKSEDKEIKKSEPVVLT